MARTAELSPNYFCRYFKKIAGCSPVEYLIEYRLNMAAFMLVNTEETVADVSLACGFNDASHFIKFFRRQKGVTPRRYRQMHAKQTPVD
jgi:AraC-like DNA-binding protein